MKCTNDIGNQKKRICALLVCAVLVLTGCGAEKYERPYNSNYQVSSFRLMQTADANAKVAETFAADLCVVDKDVSNSEVALSDVASVALFDVDSLDTLYAKNANEQLDPASLTKVMTALVALKHGSPEQLLTAGDNVLITEPGAQLCGIKPGDTMTLEQALHVLLLYSANDVANMIADGVGGSIPGFVELMNEEAQELGATNCHFTNPNGLTEEGHYMTAYDLYLIFMEAMQYDLFKRRQRAHVGSKQFQSISGWKLCCAGEYHRRRRQDRHDKSGRTLSDSAFQRQQRKTVCFRHYEC